MNFFRSTSLQNTLVDSGPLVALFAADESHHRWVARFIKGSRLRLSTTWPVVTEVCAILSRSRPAMAAFLEWVARGGLVVEDLVPADLPTMLALMRKYADLPMDLADASLVVLAQRTGRDTIVSLDSDFEVYRLHGKRPFRNLLSRRK